MEASDLITRIDEMESRIVEGINARIEPLLTWMREFPDTREAYGVADFAKRVHKATFTVRQWCLNGRINAAKR